MNNPNCSTPACQDRPDLAHQRKNNTMPIAYAFVVDSAPSRPNRRCRKNSSATVTTASSSSSTVQYLTPDGNLTKKARIVAPLIPIGSLTSISHEHYTRRDTPQNPVTSPV
jgi:hypothetical protein